jgi:hypothetical protein
VDGLRDSINDFSSDISGTSAGDVMNMMMTVQYLGKLKEFTGIGLERIAFLLISPVITLICFPKVFFHAHLLRLLTSPFRCALHRYAERRRSQPGKPNNFLAHEQQLDEATIGVYSLAGIRRISFIVRGATA